MSTNFNVADHESITPQLSDYTLTEAIADAKLVRQTALAKEEIRNKNIVQQKISDPKVVKEQIDTLLDEDKNKVISVIGNETYKSNLRGFEEAKKLIDNFREKVSKYPKYTISFDGSTKLCALLSLNTPAEISFGQLPMEDQDTLRKSIKNTPFSDISYFYVMYDEQKDFRFIFSKDKEEGIVVNMFNSFTHPEVVKYEIPVKKVGEQVNVGNSILLDKERIKKLIGVDPQKKSNQEDDPTPKRQPVAGRNAYEIRADVLQMAIDWSGRDSISKQYSNPEDLIDLAKKFYQFVENRRQ